MNQVSVSTSSPLNQGSIGSVGSIKRDALAVYLATLLEIERFRDYCPNGLQVEGKPEISSIVTAVSANAEVLEQAFAKGADALLVHHGYFWKNEDGRITGTRKQRIARVLQHDLNLFGFHLPLDAHPTLGNNVQLAQRLQIIPDGQLASEALVWHGRLEVEQTLEVFARQIEQTLQRPPLVIGAPQQPIRTIAWCTGGAQSYFEAAVAAGVDVYLTGEISEQHYHLARESGVAFIAAGHHATERYGIQALGQHLADKFGLAHQFIDSDNPV